MATTTWQRLQARREGLSTYLRLPAVLGCGALAAAIVIMAPFWFRLVTSTVAYFDRLFSFRSSALAWVVFRQGMKPAFIYTTTLWPYIVLVIAGGVYLAWLRRTKGLYYREIPWRPYEQRVRLPIRLHRLICYIAGPVLLLAMAYTADKHVYPVILRNNFAIWLSAGAAALVVWEALMDLFLSCGILLRLWPGPNRRLDMELELKDAVQSDAQLGETRLYDVMVYTDGKACLVGEWTPAQQQRVREVTRTISTIKEVEIVPPALGEAPPSSGTINTAIPQ